MKNIFVLPSERSSLYFYDKELKYNLDGKAFKSDYSGVNISPQNIYITNSEEINKDTKPCWCINTIKNTWNDDLIYYQGAMPQYHYIGFKKIILTSDPELIKNGVQEVSNEFLEWFVAKANDSGKPIDIVEVRKEKYSERFDNDKSAIGDVSTWGNRWIPIIPTQEQKQDLHFAFDVPKQETIEEVAHKYAREQPINKTSHMMGFIAGAKHQSEKMFVKVKNGELLLPITDKNYLNVVDLYGKKYNIEPVCGTNPKLKLLDKNQSVVYGDGETYHFLLTEK